MSILAVLKAIGKDLSHVGGWIDDGLKIAEPVIDVVDPPVGVIITQIEVVLSNVLKANGNNVNKITPAFVQSITQGITAIEAVKSNPAISLTQTDAGKGLASS